MQAAKIEQGKIQWVSAQQEDQQPGPGQVTIRIGYAGVNRADVMQVAGAYPPPEGASEIPGLECSGVITAVGEQVSKLHVGQKVAALLAAGGYAESVTVSAQQVLPVPAGWQLRQAAGWLETFATAYLNVFQLGQLSSADRVFAHAGASGVGTSLIQLCKEQGNPIYVAVGSDDKCRLCEQLGATQAFNRHQQDYLETLTGLGKVDVVLNPVAGDSVARDQQILNDDGRIIIIGLMGARQGTVDFGRLLVKRQRIIGSTLRALSAARKGDILTAMWRQFGAAFSAGRVTPVIDKEFDARQVNKALDYLRDDRSQGKVVLKIAELESQQY